MYDNDIRIYRRYICRTQFQEIHKRIINKKIGEYNNEN